MVVSLLTPVGRGQQLSPATIMESTQHISATNGVADACLPVSTTVKLALEMAGVHGVVAIDNGVLLIVFGAVIQLSREVSITASRASRPLLPMG